jgi:hypothetical protein
MILEGRNSGARETFIARQQLGKQVPTAKDTQATIEESFETMFSIQSV